VTEADAPKACSRQQGQAVRIVLGRQNNGKKKHTTRTRKKKKKTSNEKPSATDGLLKHMKHTDLDRGVKK